MLPRQARGETGRFKCQIRATPGNMERNNENEPTNKRGPGSAPSCPRPNPREKKNRKKINHAHTHTHTHSLIHTNTQHKNTRPLFRCSASSQLALGQLFPQSSSPSSPPSGTRIADGRGTGTRNMARHQPPRKRHLQNDSTP